MTLYDALLWVVGGGGAGVLAFKLMDKLALNVGSEWRRYISLALTAAIACGVYVAGILVFHYGFAVPAPTTAVGWVEALFATAFAAVTSAQAIHGATALREYDKKVKDAAKE